MPMHPLPGTDPADVKRRLTEIAEAERRGRRLFRRTLALLLFWPLLGLLGMAWGFQMEDPDAGPAIFFAAVAVADLGIVGTLIAAHRRALA